MNYIQPYLDSLKQTIGECPDPLLDLYALLAMIRSVNTSLEDVHDAWAVWQNHINPEHRSLKPFENLTEEVQQLDYKYMKAIHRAALDVWLDSHSANTGEK